MQTFYETLINSGKIVKDENTYGPCRAQRKKVGFMWECDKCVVLNDTRIFQFKLWTHFHEDTGTQDWKPTKEQMSSSYIIKSRWFK